MGLMLHPAVELCWANSCFPMYAHSWLFQFSADSYFDCRPKSSSSCCFGMTLAASLYYELSQAVGQLHLLLLLLVFGLQIICHPSSRDTTWSSCLMAQTANRWRSLVLWEHLQALIFLLRHQLCRYILQNSYRLFCFQLSSSSPSICGRDLPHQIDRSSRYWFQSLLEGYKEESSCARCPSRYPWRMGELLFHRHRYDPV